MQTIALSSLPVASYRWHSPRFGRRITVVCRATFLLEPGESPLAPEQLAPERVDHRWDGEVGASVIAARDLVPFKPQAEVLVSGHAWAPHGRAVRSLTARLVVGDIDKPIDVVGRRSFRLSGELEPPAPFVKMPLRWELAAGGPGTANPVGISAETADLRGAVAVPCLIPHGFHVTSRDAHIPSVGLGPIAPEWDARRARLGQRPELVLGHAGDDLGWPDDADPSFWNAAPLDQRTHELRSDERIVLENLHPRHPRLVTNLAGVKPRAFVVGSRRPPQDLAMVCDTLWIDTDRGIATLTWRGHVAAAACEDAEVVVAVEGRGERLSWEAVDALRAERQADATFDLAGTTFAFEAATVAAPLPFTGAPCHPPSPAIVSGAGRADSVVPPAPPAPLGGGRSAPPLAWPVGAAVTTGVRSIIGAPCRPPSPAIAPPPLVTGLPERPDLASAARSGAAAASDAAAALEGAAAPGEPTRIAATSSWPAAAERRDAERPPSAFEVVWVEEEAVPAIRRELVAGADPLDEFYGERDAVDADGMTPRADVATLLARARPLPNDGLDGALLDALDGEARPGARRLHVVHGRLALPFDDRKALEAVVALVQPYAGTDKRLREILDGAAPALAATGWALGADVVAGLRSRIEEAAHAARPGCAAALEVALVRALLDARAYVRRTVLGAPRIRAVLATPEGRPVAHAYLPAAVAESLPLLASFAARLVVELRLPQEEDDPHPAALRVVALARELDRRRNASTRVRAA